MINNPIRRFLRALSSALVTLVFVLLLIKIEGNPTPKEGHENVTDASSSSSTSLMELKDENQIIGCRGRPLICSRGEFPPRSMCCGDRCVDVTSDRENCVEEYAPLGGYAYLDRVPLSKQCHHHHQCRPCRHHGTATTSISITITIVPSGVPSGASSEVTAATGLPTCNGLSIIVMGSHGYLPPGLNYI
ncbi:hypothetical protein glysoja_003928 [Glycine soja]|nr:hypothetical protein glysoja_003928 [Glycine soja]